MVTFSSKHHCAAWQNSQLGCRLLLPIMCSCLGFLWDYDPLWTQWEFETNIFSLYFLSHTVFMICNNIFIVYAWAILISFYSYSYSLMQFFQQCPNKKCLLKILRVPHNKQQNSGNKYLQGLCCLNLATSEIILVFSCWILQILILCPVVWNFFLLKKLKFF